MGFKGLIENWQNDLVAAVTLLIALPLSGIALAANASAILFFLRLLVV